MIEKLKTLPLRAKLLVKSHAIKTHQDLMEVLHEGFMSAPYGSNLKNKLALLSRVAETDCIIFSEFPNPSINGMDNIRDILNWRKDDLQWLLIHG